jgi:hypothetical protein
MCLVFVNGSASACRSAHGRDQQHVQALPAEGGVTAWMKHVYLTDFPVRGDRWDQCVSGCTPRRAVS